MARQTAGAHAGNRVYKGGLVGLACLIARVTAQEVLSEMEFVLPLYIAPKYENGTLAAQWEALHDSASTGANVFGILNPASGPGAHTQPNYLDTIDYVKGAGAKLLCYVATTYGEKPLASVESEIEAYQRLYPGACDGIFFDESPFLLGDMLDIYTAHNTFAHQELDLAPDAVARVVFNTGQPADEQYYSFSPPAEVVNMENYFKRVRQLGLRQTPAISTPRQNMLLLHSATELVERPQLIPRFMKKAYCKGYGTMYVTDDLFDEGNPWDDPPTFLSAMLDAAKTKPSVEECQIDGLKVLAPLLGSDPADVQAIVTTADPGDYGDLITVAMDVKITESEASTDAAAAVRDAGAKVLCYIDATDTTDMAALEDAVESFTYFPLNEICAGFLFGGFDIAAALDDIPALQSLYLKTQKTFLQATVVFAPAVVDSPADEDDDGGSYSFSFDLEGEIFEFGDDGDDWTESSPVLSQFYLPWQQVMSNVDIDGLVEALILGLAPGATEGDIIVATSLDGMDSLPLSGGPPENCAALVTGYVGSPHEVMFELFAKDWGYGYVTNMEHFVFLADGWAQVVQAARDTNNIIIAPSTSSPRRLSVVTEGNTHSA